MEYETSIIRPLRSKVIALFTNELAISWKVLYDQHAPKAEIKD